MIEAWGNFASLSDTSIVIRTTRSSGDTQALVSTIAAAVAAIAALCSTAMALWFHRDQGRFRRADKLGRYYERIVTSPVMHALESLKGSTSDLITPAVDDITKLCEENAAQTAVRTRVKKLIDDFDTQFQTLRDIVATVIGSWEDKECNNALRAELENLEDTVKREMETLALDQAKSDARKVVVEGMARFYAAIMKHDPSLKILRAKKQPLGKGASSTSG